jgi:hypothetical protein
MVRQLLADGVPIGFSEWIISFVIKPDRAGMYSYQIRNRHMIPWFLQTDSSLQDWRTRQIILIDNNL